MKNLEIERKFLIRYPDTEYIESIKDCKKVIIDQTYLKDKTRIRSWSENGKTTYIKTKKENINELIRIEKESEISEIEYTALMVDKDPDRNTISKIRYRFPFSGKLIEIDIFPFWNDRAFLEIELESQEDDYQIPPFIKVIKEVTFDLRYRNSALAKEIPKDKI